jgi:membrane protease YdiL (CAAX protease family)
MTSSVSVAPRRLWLEPAGPDFPLYNDVPPISASRWLVMLGLVAAGFAALVLPLPFTDGGISGWLRAAAFVLLPLIGLALAAPGRWRAIFRPVGWREVRLMAGFALLNILVSFAVGALVKAFGTVTANAKVAGAIGLDGPQTANFFLTVVPQLLGEELITILPFLAILAWCRARGIGRNAAVLTAWVASAILFGLLHLPTYDWNLVQCLVVIGTARLVLTWAYVWSKNLWVSTGAHILNDWAIMAATIFLAPLVAAA